MSDCRPVRLTKKQWKEGYRIWRVPFAHLPPDVRGRMVRGCQGKVQYHTADQAAEKAYTLPVRGNDKRWLKVYKCPLCQTFHIGNTNWRENGFTVRDLGPQVWQGGL